ncbi:MAG: hypothetical protein ACR2KT_03950 [Methylocella sp.]
MEAGGTTALSGLPISNPPGRFMPPIRDFSNQNLDVDLPILSWRQPPEPD